MAEEENLFGQEIKRLRREASYTQGKLAKLAGISASYISQLETGYKKPTDRVITKLSGPLGVPENSLLITVGKIKMDLAGTLATERREAPEIINSLSEKQWQELLTYLAYIKVKSSITD
jgi:transcriptional regulator with XRE-family HTH domain